MHDASNQQDPEVVPQQDAVVTEGADVLAAAQAQAADYLSGWQRAMADYANLKKDMERLSVDVAATASAKTLRPVLEVFDSFTKAAAHAPELPDLDALKPVAQWVSGIGTIRGQFESALRRLGVEPVDKAGVPFDPNVHEAMLSQTQEGTEPGMVLAILEPGYLLHGKVVRTAKVTVSQ
jgi:molecular chaperone GrpE